MSNNFQHLSTPLPPELGGSSGISDVNQVTDFLKKFVPPSDQKEIDAEFNKNIPVLSKPTAKKKWKQPQKTKKGEMTSPRCLAFTTLVLF